MVNARSAMVTTLAAASSFSVCGAPWANLPCLSPYQKGIPLAPPKSSHVRRRCGGSDFGLPACRVVRKESTSKECEEHTHRRAAVVVFEGKSPGGLEIETGKCIGDQKRFFVVELMPPYGMFGNICKPKNKCRVEGFQLLKFDNSTFLNILGTMFNITDWNGKEALSEGELSLFTLGLYNDWAVTLSSMPIGRFGEYQFNLQLNINGTNSSNHGFCDANRVGFTSFGDASALCNQYTCDHKSLPENPDVRPDQTESDLYKADYTEAIYVAAGVVGFIGLLCLCLCAVKIKERYQ